MRVSWERSNGKEKNIKIIRYYVDGIRGVIDSKYPFIVIEND